MRETKCKAKKEHCCIWCGQKILIGEVYLRTVGVYDGEFYSQAFHLECHNAAQSGSDYDNEFNAYDNERPATP